MAKRLRFNYTFSPSTKTIIVDGNISQKRLLLITNTKTNTLIYAFADQTLTATSVTYNSTTNQTTIVVSFDTTSMAATDPLQIFTEDDNVSFVPEEGLYDAVNKFRVSQPQALIDTDFEYGTQPTKWENLAMVNYRPFAYVSNVGLGTINFITMPQGSKTVTVGLFTGGTGLTATPGIGTAITVQDTFLPIANGNWVIDSVGGGGTTFTYQAKSINTTSITSILDATRTGIFSGTQYTSCSIGSTPTFVISNSGGRETTGVGLAVTVTTTIPHNLSIGNAIAVVGTSVTNINGNYNVTSILDSQRFVYYVNSAPSAPAGAPNPVAGGLVFTRPQALFLHRPYDGGVLFSTNPTSNYEQAVRQTRRYFRYQSGKGFQISTGTILKPNLQIDSLTSTGLSIGSTINVVTKDTHNILAATPGTKVSIFGSTDTGYNGTYTVQSVTGYNSFTVTSTAGIGSTVATGNYNLSIVSWYGSKNRMGAFDQQNGLFFEFDGQNLFVCRRNSTYQLAGRVSVASSTCSVTQTSAQYPTSFTKQLVPGDFIVIRGQSHRVVNIESDTSLTISPGYRGPTIANAIASKTIDTKVRQSDFNIDKCDGTGPSGFNMDLSKMQMFYIDYSWYGAGFVRYGFRSLDGNVRYVHKTPNNNVNTEAYMRSGNLPARYESVSEPFVTTLTSNLAFNETGAVGVASTSGFPDPASVGGGTGLVLVRQGNTYEYINYTGIAATALTGLTRAGIGSTALALTGISTGQNVATAATSGLQVGMRVTGFGGTAFPDATFISAIGAGTLTFSQPCQQLNPTVVIPPLGSVQTVNGVGIGTTFTFSSSAPTTVENAYPTFGPSISHWGTSVIMDGRFDDDKSLVFTYGQTTSTIIPVSIGSSERALFSIRVAPSVDNGQTGPFGNRELVNRMQLTLKALDLTTLTSNANLLVRAYLNAVPTTATLWTNAVGNRLGAQNSSFAQIADYGGGSVNVSGGEVTAGFFVGSGANSIPLTDVRDLGNSVLGGGSQFSNTNIYPDGPDTLTITVTNLGSTAVSVFGRISWTEAQA